MAKDWTTFIRKIGVKASLETMYNAWATSSGIEKWFLETCKYKHRDGSALAGSQPVTADCTYEWTWYLYDVLETGKINDANGSDFLQFTFADECLVDIELKQFGEHVLVVLTQHNIPTDEPSKFNIRIDCYGGWTFYLANLKSVYENGYDLRNKIPELKGINN